MKFSMKSFAETLRENDIQIIFNGPMWANGIKKMEEILLDRLAFNEVEPEISQSINLVFREMANNILMHSSKKENHLCTAGAELLIESVEASQGLFILRIIDGDYVLSASNPINKGVAKTFGLKLDYINGLSSAQLAKLHREKLFATPKDGNHAGVGIIEILRKASGKIEYEFEDLDDTDTYFTMSVKIKGS